MNLHGELLPSDIYGLIWLLAALGLLACFRRAPWAQLTDVAKINAWLGASIVVAAIWLLKAGVRPNLDLHLLGATALTLMVGPYLALLGLLLVLLALAWLGVGDWQNLALNWLLLAWIPVWISHALLRICQRNLPPNYFIYIFVNAFLGGALAMLASGAGSGLFHWLAQTYPADVLLEEYLPFYLLLAFSEAFSTGMALTMFVVYRPQWVMTFDDAVYLRKRH
jgi:uncharacterized membrane protein